MCSHVQQQLILGRVETLLDLTVRYCSCVHLVFVLPGWRGSSNVIVMICQYIQQNIRSDCSNIDKILEPPEGQDEGVWKYEHLR